MSWTRAQLDDQVAEAEKDLRAFAESRAVLERRLAELEGTNRHDFLHEWAAYQCVINAQIMAITRCEGLVEDLKAHRDKLPAAPQLSLVERRDDNRR